jgi:hypothetical protein
MQNKYLKKIALVLVIFVILYFIWYSIDTKQKVNYEKISNSSDKSIDKVLYIVLTSEKTLFDRGLAVWDTWGKHLDIVFACNCKNLVKLQKLKDKSIDIPNDFKKYEKIINLPILYLNVTEDPDKMGVKVLKVLELSYEKYVKTKKWYFMVDDDTYVYPNNLEKFINTQDTSKPVYYGFKYNHEAKPAGFIGGGSGILFTNEAMKKIVAKIKSHECDKFAVQYGDVTIGECAQFVNVTIGSSNDKNGKPRFNYNTPKVHYEGPIPSYLYDYGTHNKKIGKDCCSPESISFHYVNPATMYSIHANTTLLKDLFS